MQQFLSALRMRPYGKDPCSLIVIVVLTVFLALSVDNIMAWRISNDVGILSYTGWLSLQGLRPYVDFLEYNTPLCHLLYALQVFLCGTSSLHWVVWLGIWHLVAVAGICVFLRRFPLIDRILASVLFLVMQTAGGHWLAGQKDFFSGVFLLWGCAVLIALFVSDRFRSQKALVSGLLFGIAWAIRPQQVIVPLVLFPLMTTPSERKKTFLPFVIGLLVPWLLSLTWLWVIGSLPEYTNLVFGFLIPIYTTIHYIPSAELFNTFFQFFGPLLPLFCFGVFSRKALRPEHTVACYCIVLTFFAYVVQHKGWNYQFEPAILFFAILTACAIKKLNDVVYRSPVAVSLVLLVSGAAFSPFQRLSDQSLATWADSPVYEIEEALKKFELADARIQPLDTTAGSLVALFFLHKSPATRFVYDSYFYFGRSAPFKEQVRQEFMKKISDAPPDFFIYTDASHSYSYERLNSFLELRSFFEQHYKICKGATNFWLYVKNETAAGHDCQESKSFHEQKFKNTLTFIGQRLMLRETN